MKKTMSVFAAAMAVLSSFAAPQKAADFVVAGYTDAAGNALDFEIDTLEHVGRLPRLGQGAVPERQRE